MISRKAEISIESGFHARPAAVFVNVAKKFKSKITIKNINTGKEVDGKSIVKIMTAALTYKTPILIIAEGEDEEEMVNALIMTLNYP